MAKKFHFRLQSVLDLKEFKQKLLMQDLADLLQELAQQEQKLAVLQSSLYKAKKDVRQALVADINSLKIKLFHEYIDYLYSSIAKQVKIIAGLKKDIAQKRDQIREAEKEKKVIAKMKDNQFIDYKKEISTKQQKDADERSVQKAASDKGGPFHGKFYSY